MDTARAVYLSPFSTNAEASKVIVEASTITKTQKTK